MRRRPVMTVNCALPMAVLFYFSQEAEFSVTVKKTHFLIHALFAPVSETVVSETVVSEQYSIYFCQVVRSAGAGGRAVVCGHTVQERGVVTRTLGSEKGASIRVSQVGSGRVLSHDEGYR